MNSTDVTNIIFAALRVAQDHIDEMDPDILDGTEVNDVIIDDLCEDLNVGEFLIVTDKEAGIGV